MDAARAFFDEWDHRTPGSRRSLRRARLLIDRLGGADPGVPVLTVVGSKGKGTAAAYASAWLAARGLRLLTVTSPPPRRDTERIRVGGAAISAAELDGLGARLRAAARGLPPEPGGHLSPSGLFTIAGMLHARAAGADAVVLEAGMGGASDEASLFPPAVVAITSVFAEHVGVLGGTPAEIAADKAGVAGPGTSAVVSLPQAPEVAAAIAATVAARTSGRIRPEVVAAGASGVPERLLPGGLGRMNAELGCVAAARLLAGTSRPPAGAGVDAALERVLASVRLPGRASWHDVPGTGSTVFVDSAIDRSGAAAALAEARRRVPHLDHVLVCLPDHKDVAGVATVLAGLPVTYVTLRDHPHLRFGRDIPAGWAVTDAAELTRDRLAGLGRHVAALGTAYFTARVLDLADADTERLFTP